MILLQGHSLARKDWFLPESMSLSLEERTSTASMTLGPEAPEISVGDWMLDDTEPGKGIVWRAKTVSTDVGTRTRTVQLEHVIQALRDLVLFGEIKPENISGGETCTTREAAAYILRGQSEWRLGDVAVSRSAPYNFNGDSLYSALETVTGSVEDLQWEYDLSSMPFTLHLRKYPAGFQSEMRMRRNISKMRIQIDRTRMYTRLYPIGENNLHISGDYVSRNENIWGTISKVLTDQTKGTEEELRTWATQNLKRHCEPLVTVTITGLDLSRATGEPLDRIVVGRRCRVPIPKYGITMTERVTKMTWADKIRKPEEIGVTLANLMEDVASIINQRNESTASSSASGRRGAKKNEEDHAWFVDTTDHVAMVAEAVAGPGASKDWSRVAEVLVDGQGIHQRVTETEGGLVKHEARLEINEKAIQAEVKERTKGDQINAGMLDIQSDRVGLLVGQKESRKVVTVASFSDLSGYAGDTARIYYIANEKKYYEWKNGRWIENVGPGNYINAGGIVSAINADGSVTTRIKGDRILVGNNVEKTLAGLKLPEWMDTTSGLIAEKATVGQFQALDARIGTLETDAITTANLSAKIAALGTVNVSALKASGNVTVSGAVFGSQFYVGTAAPYKNISDGIAAVQVTGPSSNVYTLQYKRFSDSAWQDAGNFSRAVASWTMGWSSGKFTAKANPQNQSCNTTLVQGTPSWDGNVVTIPVEAIDSDNPNYQYATGRSVVANAAARYNAGYVAGWNAARAKVTRIGNSVHRPKARSGTDITTDVGTEAYATAGLNNYSAWGAARLYLQRKTPGGTTSWEKVANFDTEYSVTSGTTTYYFKAYDGYYGWNTQPAIEWQ